MNVCMYVCMYECMYVCTCIHTYTHTYIHTYIRLRKRVVLTMCVDGIIMIIVSSSSSSSSTQRSARRPVDEMHVFQKALFSPRPEASCQVYFNAKTHILKLRCKKTKRKTLA